MKHKLKLFLGGGALIFAAASFSAQTTSPEVPIEWVIGINASDSVTSRGDNMPTLVNALNLACSLPTSDTYKLVKVYRQAQIAISESPIPLGISSALTEWKRDLKPFPEPSSVKGTRSDQFWKIVASEAASHPDQRVIGVLIGDGFSEGSESSVFAEANKQLCALTNFAGAIYVGIAPGADPEIHATMAAVDGKHLLHTIANVRQYRDVPDQIATFIGDKQ